MLGHLDHGQFCRSFSAEVKDFLWVFLSCIDAAAGSCIFSLFTLPSVVEHFVLQKVPIHDSLMHHQRYQRRIAVERIAVSSAHRKVCKVRKACRDVKLCESEQPFMVVASKDSISCEDPPPPPCSVSTAEVYCRTYQLQLD
jgi:hypothetical protein